MPFTPGSAPRLPQSLLPWVLTVFTTPCLLAPGGCSVPGADDDATNDDDTPAGDDDSGDDDDTTPADLTAFLTERGSYSVGFRESEVIYPDEVDGGDRRLRLCLWYPSDAISGEDLSYWDLFPAEGVWRDAHPAVGPFPVALFSHGDRGFAENSGFLMAHLASHGFLVVAPDHTTNTLFDYQDRTTSIYAQRPRDITAVLDHLESLPQGDPLEGMPGEPAALIGHSFGGYTTHAVAGAAYAMGDLVPACEEGTGPSGFCSTLDDTLEAVFDAGFRDKRIASAVSMAPGDLDLFAVSGLTEIPIPLLLLGGTLDGNAAAWPDFWAGLERSGNLFVEVTGGGHNTFTDFSGSIDEGEGLIEPQQGFRITDAFVLAFLLNHRGDPVGEPLLSGSLTPFPEVTLHLPPD